MTGTGGQLAFTAPDGTAIDTRPPRLAGDAAAVVDQNAQLGLTMTAETTGSLGNGGRFDRAMTSDYLWCLLHPDHILGTQSGQGAGSPR